MQPLEKSVAFAPSTTLLRRRTTDAHLDLPAPIHGHTGNMSSSSYKARFAAGLLLVATAASRLSVGLAATISVQPGGLQSALDKVGIE